MQWAFFSSRLHELFSHSRLMPQFSFHTYFTHDLHTFSFHNSFIFLFIQFALFFSLKYFSCLLHVCCSAITQPTNHSTDHPTVCFFLLVSFKCNWNIMTIDGLVIVLDMYINIKNNKNLGSANDGVWWIIHVCTHINCVCVRLMAH